MRLYYRVRKEGAMVFRLEVENRQRRLELLHIATINARGEILPHKRRQPTDDEMTEIATWWDDYSTRRTAGELSDAETAIAGMQHLANWLSKDAKPEEVEAISDFLLMAVHDLRQVVVRRLSQGGAADED